VDAATECRRLKLEAMAIAWQAKLSTLRTLRSAGDPEARRMFRRRDADLDRLLHALADLPE
jgi:hypothetical protein